MGEGDSKETRWKREQRWSHRRKSEGAWIIYTDEHSEGYLRYSLRDFLKLCNVAKSMEALLRGLEEDRR